MIKQWIKKFSPFERVKVADQMVIDTIKRIATTPEQREKAIALFYVLKKGTE